MNDKLQEIVNKAYWDFYKKEDDATVPEIKGGHFVKSSLDKVPYKFIYLLEKHGCLLDHMPFEKKPKDIVIVKHPHHGTLYPNLLIPYEFAVKVVALGYLPNNLN